MRRDEERMSQPPPAGCVRLIFEYEGDEIRLISRQAVDVTPPAGDPFAGSEREQGFWMEVRDATERALFRRVMPDPVAQYPEVFSDAPEQNIVRDTTPVQRGAFTVLVPDLPAGDHLSLIRTGAGPAPAAVRGVARGTGEIARFSLRGEPDRNTEGANDEHQ